MFVEAIERAKYLDGYLLREGKPLGPFHGMPISVKVSTRSLNDDDTTMSCNDFKGLKPVNLGLLYGQGPSFHPGLCFVSYQARLRPQFDFNRHSLGRRSRALRQDQCPSNNVGKRVMGDGFRLHMRRSNEEFRQWNQ